MTLPESVIFREIMRMESKRLRGLDIDGEVVDEAALVVRCDCAFRACLAIVSAAGWLGAALAADRRLRECCEASF